MVNKLFRRHLRASPKSRLIFVCAFYKLILTGFNPGPTNRDDLPDRRIATKWLQIVKVYLTAADRNRRFPSALGNFNFLLDSMPHV